MTGGANTPSVVSVRDVRYSYDSRSQVLAGVSVEVAEGETVGIVGPSGCGKSTLLRIIAGLQRPTGGTIERNLRVGRHPVSMLFQEDTLVPSRTVRANCDLFFRYNRTKYKDRSSNRARVDEILTMIGLRDRADYYPIELSGGMRRRVAFASVMVSLPHLLLLDEPFAGVDEPTRIGIHDDVRTALRRFEMTAILVTHDIAEAVSLCDKVVILSRPPARVAAINTIEIPREVPMKHLRQTPEFLSCYGSLWSQLSEQIDVS